MRLQQLYERASTIAITDAERQQKLNSLTHQSDSAMRGALEQRDKRLWQQAIQSDRRMTVYSSIYANNVEASLSRKRIWVMENYLGTNDSYAWQQQTLVRYDGQQIRVSRGRWEKRGALIGGI